MPHTVVLPDGEEIDVETDDPQQAAAAARKYWASKPRPPVYDANNKPIDQTALYQKPQAPEPSWGEKIAQAIGKASEHPGFALGESVGKIAGAKNPESLGRDVEAFVNSQGPLGMEFAPLTGAPAATAKAVDLPTNGLKTTAQRGAEAKLNYMRAKDAGVSVSPDSFDRLVMGLTHKATTEGLDPVLHPKAYAVMQRFIKNVDRGSPPGAMAPMTKIGGRAPSKEMSLEELDTLRKQAGAAKQSPDRADRHFANIITDRLDDYLDKVTPADLGIKAGPNAKEGINALKTARKQWADMRRSETIDTLVKNAEIRAGGNLVASFDALRTEFKQLAMKINKDKREANRWTPEQRQLITQLGSVSSTVGILRGLSRLSPRHYFSMAGGALGVAGGLNPWILGGWGVGEAAYQGAKAMTNSKLDQLRGVIGD